MWHKVVASCFVVMSSKIHAMYTIPDKPEPDCEHNESDE